MVFDKFTSAQRAAINGDGEILVSASAGSGKTTVMIQRILRLLEGGEELTSMVVCTFTKSAASDMRTKLSAQLSQITDAAAEDQTSAPAWAEKAIEKLPTAEISTIDAFCARLVRNYFYYADGIDPAFEVPDEAEADALLNLSVDEAVSESLAAGDPDFDELYEILSPRRNEKRLSGIVKRMYEFAAIHPDPDAWFVNASKATGDHAGHVEALCGYYDAAIPAFLRRAAALKTRCECVGFVRCAQSVSEFYDEVLSGQAEIKKLSGIKPASAAQDELYERYKKLRSAYKDFCAEREEALLSADPSESAGTAAILTGLAQRAAKIYAAKKQRKSQCDFNDVERAAYRILCNPCAAAEVNAKYRRLFVDEFQDINPLQNAIFDKLSAKRFYVGDVKQSIYGFRLSDPGIFAGHEAAYLQSGRISGEAGAGHGERRSVIRLNANFRSDSGILRFCDRVFADVMTKGFGGVDYEGAARFNDTGLGSLFAVPVVCGLVRVSEPENSRTANYRLQAPCADDIFDPAHSVPGTGRRLPGVYSVKNHIFLDEEASAQSAEADWVVEHILSLKKRSVTEDGRERAVEFGDIAVLLRSPGKFAGMLCEKLRRAGVPVAEQKSADATKNQAARELMNYLRLIDNRRDDIALASVLKSPFGGFCSDGELAAVRIWADKMPGGAEWPFFAAAERYAGNNGAAQKLATLFRNLSRYEKISRVTGFAELAGKICAEHDYFKYALSLPDGKSAAEGLSKFLDALSGLPQDRDFCSALNAIDAGAVKISAGGEAGAVRVMTVHAAKGLEFPFVVLPNLSKAFNLDDIKRDCILNVEFGAALKRFDIKNRQTAKTSLYRRAALEARKKLCEEEMRVLYVALTRAKYQTALFARVKENYEPKEGSDALCPLDWLYPAMKPLAEWREQRSEELDAALVATRDVPVPKVVFAKPGEELMRRIRAYTDYVYPYPRLPVKLTVTQMARDGEPGGEDANPIEGPRYTAADGNLPESAGGGFKADSNYSPKPGGCVSIYKSTPPVINSSACHSRSVIRHSPSDIPFASGTDIGDAYHKFLEIADFAAPFPENLSRFSEDYPDIAKLVHKNIAENALEIIAERVRGRKYYRELPFIYCLETGVLLQGVIDLMIEGADGSIEIVDYKTGRIADEQLQFYQKQIGLYASSAERILKKPVVRKSIFAVSSGEFYEV